MFSLSADQTELFYMAAIYKLYWFNSDDKRYEELCDCEFICNCLYMKPGSEYKFSKHNKNSYNIVVAMTVGEDLYKIYENPKVIDLRTIRENSAFIDFCNDDNMSLTFKRVGDDFQLIYVKLTSPELVYMVNNIVTVSSLTYLHEKYKSEIEYLEEQMKAVSEQLIKKREDCYAVESRLNEELFRLNMIEKPVL